MYFNLIEDEINFENKKHQESQVKYHTILIGTEFPELPLTSN